MKDMKNNVSPVNSISPQALTDGTVDGTGADLQGYEGAVAVIITGTITDGTHTVQIQESTDDSTYTAVADADLQGSEPAIVAANDDTIFYIGYIGSKRYLRVSITTASSSTGGLIGASIVRGHPRHAGGVAV